ncbi:CPBP family intramembrane glutamic endopeptidase [Nocardiopsis sediminis]|uniref:CPBP family intramembrane glutamic endopeptidase n=1 Tax=Nocardiopsis sediminis TaxID=1778267 RepID=A0ABV8FYJ3_9ACTN
MAHAYGWRLRAGAAAAAVVLVAVLYSSPGLAAAGKGVISVTIWLPAAAGILLSYAATPFERRHELDVRIFSVLDGHPVRRELCWLIVCLLAFIGGTIGLAALFHAISTDIPFVISVPAVRVIFLFVLPILFVDQAGWTVSGQATAMPSLAMSVGDRWRWVGLLPIVAVLALIAVTVHPVALHEARLVFLTAVVAFFAVAIPEEIFFRGMVQTRLEWLMGRWGGIAVAAVIFGLTYAAVKNYFELSPLSMQSTAVPWYFAVLIYSVLGLLYGCVWSFYRNIWLSILLRGGVLTLAVAPTLQLIG